MHLTLTRHTNNSPPEAQKSIFAMLPSNIIARECGSCSFINEGSEPGPCLMYSTKHPRCCAIVAGATASDGVGNCVGPPYAQAPVRAAVAGVAGATVSDGCGSCMGPPVTQASVLAAVVPVPAHVAKAPAPAAEVGAPAPTCKWETKRVMKAAATAGVVSAPIPAEVIPTVCPEPFAGVGYD
jgi:hypothetical protein